MKSLKKIMKKKRMSEFEQIYRLGLAANIELRSTTIIYFIIFLVLKKKQGFQETEGNTRFCTMSS